MEVKVKKKGIYLHVTPFICCECLHIQEGVTHAKYIHKTLNM